MTELVLGRTLQTIRIEIVANSNQSFGLNWKSGGSPADLTGITASIRISSGEVWTANKSGSTTVWDLIPSQTNLPWSERTGSLVLATTSGEVVAFRVIVEVQR